MRFLTRMMVIGLLAGPALVSAHEGGEHARGTIKSIGAGEVVLSTTAGKVQAFVLDPDTKVERGTAPVRREDVRVGERAVIHARREGDKLHATEIRLAPAAARRSGEVR